MRNCTTQLLFSLTLVYLVCSASTSTSEKTRAKRSLLLDNVLHNRHRWQKHPKGTEKRSAFDTLDLDALLNDPAFLEADTGGNRDAFDFNELDFNNLPDYTDLPPLEKEKDEMSNVIPGAQGPFDFHPVQQGYATQPPFSFNNAHAYPEDPRAHKVADSLMDEFMQFLFMKDMGMLDRCLGNRKRR